MESPDVSVRRPRGSGSTGEDFALLVADVFELSGLLRRHGEQIANGHGQTQARWQLLSVISNGRWTVPSAARRLGITRQAVQRVADDLVADGQARYEQNPDHQRSHFLEITEVGRDTLASITRTAQAANRAFLDGIAEDAFERTRHVLATIMRRLDGSHHDDIR